VHAGAERQVEGTGQWEFLDGVIEGKLIGTEFWWNTWGDAKEVREKGCWTQCGTKFVKQVLLHGCWPKS